MGGPQVVIPVFVCMTLCTQTCSEVVLQIPAGTAWTKRFSSKKQETFMKEWRGVSIWTVSGEKYAYKWTPSPKQVNKIHISHGKA